MKMRSQSMSIRRILQPAVMVINLHEIIRWKQNQKSSPLQNHRDLAFLVWIIRYSLWIEMLPSFKMSSDRVRKPWRKRSHHRMSTRNSRGDYWCRDIIMLAVLRELTRLLLMGRLNRGLRKRKRRLMLSKRLRMLKMLNCEYRIPLGVIWFLTL